TGVTLLAYALIVFTLVFSSVLSGVFSGEVGKLADDEGGGYDLLVTTGSAGPVDTERLEAAGGVREAAALSWTVAGFRVGGTGTFEDWAISGFGDDFLEGGPPALESFDRAEYPNEAAVWRAVHADAGLAIADVAFLESGGGPPEDNARVGDDIQVRAPGTNTTVTRRVVALSAAGAAFSGVMVSRESLAGFVENPVVNRYYAQTAAGSDPGVVAEKLQLDFLRSGLEARPFEAVVREVLRGQEAFFDLIEGYLALGLLRALGAPASVARWALLAESGLVALGGVLIGAALALVTSYGLVAGSSAFGDGDAAFAVPWARLALLVFCALVSSLLVALPAVVRVVRTAPAAVLRNIGEGAD
ncbi:MAG: hypothetical protein H0V28_00515, partial [Rubrobacteraceae bacterium]|nr:hypothetical protein [Rubrobacteraceae bacterium]